MGTQMPTTALTCVHVIFSESVELANSKTADSFGYQKLDDNKTRFLKVLCLILLEDQTNIQFNSTLACKFDRLSHFCYLLAVVICQSDDHTGEMYTERAWTSSLVYNGQSEVLSWRSLGSEHASLRIKRCSAFKELFSIDIERANFLRKIPFFEIELKYPGCVSTSNFYHTYACMY